MSVNEPVTIYRQPDGNSEAVQTGTDFIVDTTGALLVDTAGNDVVDTGTDMVLIPTTTWAQDDSQ